MDLYEKFSDIKKALKTYILLFFYPIVTMSPGAGDYEVLQPLGRWAVPKNILKYYHPLVATSTRSSDHRALYE